MKTNGKKKKINYIIIIWFNICLFLALWFINCLYVSKLESVDKISIWAYYAENESDGHTAAVYYDVGNGFNQRDCGAARIQNKKAEIELADSFYDMKKLRLDVIDAKVENTIEALCIYYDGLKVWEISGGQLYEYIENVISIQEYFVEDDKLYVLPANNDPIIELSLEFIEKMEERIEGQIKLSSVGVFIWGVIAIIFINIIVAIGYLIKKDRLDVLESNIDSLYQRIQVKPILKYVLFFLIILGLLLILFWNYIIGEKFWVFLKYASDSYGQDYPSKVLWAERIENGLNYNSWNFSQGLGKGYGACTLTLLTWMCYFGKNAVMYLSGWSQILDILLAAIFFFFYLRVMKRRYFTSVIGAIAYAFCGHMIIRARWRVMPVEVLCAAILLLSFELFYKKKDYRWLPLSIVFLYINIGSGYYMLWYMGILLFYAVFRYCSENAGFKKKTITRFILAIVVAVPIISGSITGIVSSVSGSRMDEGISQFATVAEKKSIITDLDTIQTAFFRTIGIDIIGSGVDYSGAGDILIDPTFYCGLLLLVCVPFAFYRTNKLQKIWYTVGLTAVFAYILCVPLRMVANGFGGDFFKLSSFWIIILLIYFGTSGLDKLCNADNRLVKYLLLEMGIWILLSLIFYMINKEAYVGRLIAANLYILCFEGLLMVYLYRKDIRSILKCTLIVLCVIETVTTTYRYINTDESVTKEMIAEKEGYNDYTIEALDYLYTIDDKGTFRIGKTYSSYLYGDSLAQDYMGVRSYVGGNGNNEYVTSFYNGLNLPKRLSSNKYLEEVNVSNEVATLLGVKYILSKEDLLANPGYELLHTAGDVHVYENEYYIPLGYGYESYIWKSDFEKLSIFDKRSAILHACVVEDGVLLAGLTRIENITSIEDVCADNRISYEQEKNKVFFEPNGEDQVVVVHAKYYNENSQTFINVNYSDKEGKKGTLMGSIPLGESEDYYVIDNENITQLTFELKEKTEMKELNISFIPRETYTEIYGTPIIELWDNRLQDMNVSEDESTISGVVDADTAQLFFFPVPYDAGWNGYVDGNKVEIIRGNMGFVGMLLKPGVHEIRLEYSVSNALTEQKVLEYMGYGILLLWIAGWTLQRRQKRKKTVVKAVK